MADFDFVKVRGRFGTVVGDGPDEDQDPDVVWCDEGDVRFQPLTPYTKVADASPVPWTAGQMAIDCPLNADGYLTSNGNEFVWLVDLTSEKVNPVIPDGSATHQVQFVNVTAGGVSVTFPSVDVRLAADMVDPDTGLIDLTLVSPVPAVNAVPMVKGDKGNPGDPGPANTLAIGTVTTGDPGSDAAATITGDAPEQTLDLTIPTGTAGPVTDLEIGTVTTLDAGDAATATITGDAPSKTLNLGIPKGADGTDGTGTGTVTSVNDVEPDGGGNVTLELPAAATTDPVMDGDAAPGTSTDYARADHVHPVHSSPGGVLAASVADSGGAVDLTFESSPYATGGSIFGCAVTFTAPASGAVIVQISALLSIPTSDAVGAIHLGVATSTGTGISYATTSHGVASRRVWYNRSTTATTEYQPVKADVYIDDLTPGDDVTLHLTGSHNLGSNPSLYIGSTSETTEPVLMTVLAA